MAILAKEELVIYIPIDISASSAFLQHRDNLMLQNANAKRRILYIMHSMMVKCEDPTREQHFRSPYSDIKLVQY